MSACPALAAVPGIDASFSAAFPPIGGGSAARIVAGDTVAQQLWATIQANATYAPALAINPQRGSAAAANTAGCTSTHSVPPSSSRRQRGPGPGVLVVGGAVHDAQGDLPPA